MFNWIKNKLSPLIPDDIQKGIMTSNFCTVKIGEKISIPSNIHCFINYKDKNYLQIDEGDHVLDETNLSELCNKQRKSKKKLKKIKMDLYFVNTNPFDFSFKYKDKVEINNRLAKLIFTIKYNCNVEDYKKIFQSILTIIPDPDPASSSVLINDYLKEYLISYFLKKDLEDIKLSENMKTDINNKITKLLKKIGLKLNSLEIKIEEKTKNNYNINQSNTRVGFFDDFNSQHREENKGDEIKEKNISEKVDQNSQNKYTNLSQNDLETKNAELNSDTICPRCQNRVIKGSKYCHRCGYEIN